MISDCALSEKVRGMGLDERCLLAEIDRLNQVIDGLKKRLRGCAPDVEGDLPGQSYEKNRMDGVALEPDVQPSLLQEGSLFRQMFERHTAVMLLIDPKARMIIDANHAAAEFYGYSIEQLRGMKVSQINAQPESEIASQRQQAIRGEKSRFVFDHRLSNGLIRSVEVYISTIIYRNRTLFFSIIHDITDRVLAEEKIRNLAFYDPLTKLPNRRLLDDRLGQALTVSKRSHRYVALMLIDLDNFKLLNDTYGHAVGDLLLIEVALRLKSCVREMDTLARFGGDEFVVILSQLHSDIHQSISTARQVAEKIRKKLSLPYFLLTRQDGLQDNLVEYQCTPSIGMVVFIAHEMSAEAVLRRADVAMYQAKNLGGNQACFYEKGK
ncbi:MAG: sensor domain-containing diguanylate cyclase [Proteobacteria bacterium]|nr:sensor domain-containing diguanylate cyclase [Pseudomonadota bacterium]